uniref:Uncharacterized protein n=1 Tax=Neovison vison TaxID=452646 RepID=A0A8C7C0S2_NEOVI
MAQELSDLPHAYPRHLDASDTARSLEWSAENERRPSLQEAGALARAVQRYLPYLEALSQAAAPNAHPVTRLDRPAAQGEDPRADGVLTFTAQTAALTYAPGPWAEHPGSRPLGTRGRLQPDELSPKVDGGAERQSSVAALVTAVARKPPAPHREDDPGPRHRLRGPWKTAQVLSAPAALQKWSLPPGDPEDPPALGDETLIRSLLKDLGRQPAPAEGLSPLELGEMAHMVAAAAQGAGADGELRAAEKEAAAKPREAGVRKQAGDSGPSFHQVSHLGLKLGDHLQHPGPRLFPAAPLLMEPFKTEMKKSETPEVPLTWEEETAGVEDVRSQTYSKDRLDRPRPAQPRGRGFGELQAWVPGPSQEDASLEARARGHPSEGLWLAARPSQEEEGYIVTGNEPCPVGPEEGRRFRIRPDGPHGSRAP